MAYQKYTELEVWKQSRQFATYIYNLISSFLKEETYGLISQIRRCSVSVPSNIAEGIAFDIGFLIEVQPKECLEQIEVLGKLINGYIRHLNNQTPKELTNNK